MINFHNVNKRNTLFSPSRLLGKLVRAPLGLIPAEAVLPILQGPGRGLKWIAGSYNHGCWLGSYEYEKQLILPKIVRAGDVIYDIGAHRGYFTIILAQLTGPTGVVYCFEPFISNFRYLQRHLAINRLNNVIAIQAGISAENGTASFQAGPHPATGSRSSSGPFTFTVYNLIDYIKEHHLRAPNLIKMDIEGEEINVVPSIIDYVTEHHATLLISSHSNAISTALVTLLTSYGYSVCGLQWAGMPKQKLVTNATLLLATS